VFTQQHQTFQSSNTTYNLLYLITKLRDWIRSNADKTKYMVMSREQTAGLGHTMEVDNSSTERVEEFK
jgi:hypothetical protein